MVKSLFLITATIVVSLSALSYGQITIQSSDYNIAVGTFYTSKISTSVFDYNAISGGTGGGHSWDISALVFNQASSSQTVDPATAPQSSAFPTANICFYVSNSWTFMQKTSSQIFFLGNVLEFPANVYTITKYSPPEVFFVFPMTYGTTWTTTRNHTVLAPSQAIDSIVTVDTSTFSYDAYGSIKYKSNQANCLRLRQNDHSIITNWRGNTKLSVDTTRFEQIQFITEGNLHTVSMIKESTTVGDFYTTSADADFIGTATAVGDIDDASLPASFGVEQNSPNPFNPATTIRYHLDQMSNVVFEVVNAIGQTVSHQDFGVQSPGTHEVSWDADKGGRSLLPSGVYFYRLTAGTNSVVKRMVLLK